MKTTLLSLLLLVSFFASANEISAAKKADKLFSKITQIQEHAKDADEFISELPNELRKNFTFVHTSRSPHREEATYNTPRIILFTDDARIVLAFESDPTKPGYNMVELLRYVDSEKRFELRASILSGREENPFNHLVGTNWQKNPVGCLKCHGEDVRPIFDSYPLWPGFYGSSEDTFPLTDHGPTELKHYQEFLENSRPRPPFNRLIWSDQTPVPPFLDPKKHNTNTEVGELQNFKFMPNTRLGVALTELNRERLSRLILESPKLKTYSEALLSGLLRCTRLPLSKDYKKKIETEMQQENLARLFRMRIDANTKYDSRHDLQELRFSYNLAALDYFTKILGLDRKFWSMAFEPYSFSFFDGVLSSVFQNTIFYVREDFIYILLRDLAKRDKRFRPFFQSNAVYSVLNYPFGNRLDFSQAFKSCDLLDKVAAQKKIKLPAPNPTDEVVGPGLYFASVKKDSSLLSEFSKCVECHDSEAAWLHARPIPFAHRDLLNKALVKPVASSDRTLKEEIMYRINSSGAERMPPAYAKLPALSKEEIQKISDYLSK